MQKARWNLELENLTSQYREPTIGAFPRRRQPERLKSEPSHHHPTFGSGRIEP